MQEWPKVYEILNEESNNPLILTCEHASALIPKQYHNLGISEELLDTHIARDKGCKELTMLLSQKMGCTAFLAGYSRLLIDYNRREHEESLILEESDKIKIPGNINLSKKEREDRLNTYHRPYYQAIFKKIEALQSKGITPQIFSIHSFTAQLKGGDYRPWHAGILYVKTNPLAQKLLEGLKEYSALNVDANVPYDMRQYNTGAAAICGEDRELENAVIEIRDTEFEDIKQGAQKWADILKSILEK